MELKGSRTEADLATAFAGESEARNRYDFYAKKAREDGYEQIAAIFEETAKNEEAHAKIWFGLLNGGEKRTPENLLSAAEAAVRSGERRGLHKGRRAGLDLPQLRAHTHRK